MDSTYSWYTHRFYHFLAFTWILPLPVLALKFFRYFHGFYLIPVLALSLPFFGTHTGSTLSRYSPGHFFGTRPDSYSVLSGILPIPGTRADSTIFLYSHGFNPFPVLTSTVFSYSQGMYLFPVLALILPFSSTHTDSTPFRYSP